MLDARAGAAARHGFRLRDLRRARGSSARSTCPPCSGARSRTPTSATGWTSSTPGVAMCPRPACSCSASPSRISGLHRLQISIIPRNRPSRRVAQKLWLRGEGIALRYLEIDGRWEDHVRYAITSEEWTERRDRYLRQWLSEPPDVLSLLASSPPMRSRPPQPSEWRTTAGECLKNASTSASYWYGAIWPPMARPSRMTSAMSLDGTCRAGRRTRNPPPSTSSCRSRGRSAGGSPARPAGRASRGG